MGKTKKSDKDARKAEEKAAKEAKKAAKKAKEKAEKDARKVAKKAQEKAEKKAGKKAEKIALELAAETVAAPVVPDLTATSFSELLKVAPGTDLSTIDPRSTPGFDGDKASARAAMPALAEVVGDLQERLWAEAKMGGERTVLLVVQGMDTSGKGGIMRHVVGAVDPQGVQITAFKAPTAEEKAHPFLWRIRNALPEAGHIGVFDRSHYEDVLVVRVHDLVPRAQWSRRYSQINNFEKGLVADGTTVIKVMLHLSKDEQKARLMERLDRPDKHWKFNPGDIDERSRWEDYQEAYQAVVDKTSTDEAPWYVVPCDRKWYAQLAVMSLLREHLVALDPQWPEADFDVEEQRQRLAET